ncbi:flippase [Comamonas aquatica]|uniref:flippase n=1 Tax=Comamonas aquatica TaxID=225991 RepID=UPI002449D583|nr:flippase [Comamonas aquatica]MDH1673213.1 flippase [Comamonas aquatica]MDH1677724.1 flippase [Comamonas aquatica]
MVKPKNSKESLRNNIIALAIVQASNYILPLISLPYLARVLGAESFGKVVFAQALMMYFILLVEYGFSWSATRKVAENRENRVLLGEIFMNIWAVQWLLIALCSVIFVSIVFGVEKFRGEIGFYAAAFLIVLGNVLFPIWFFQGVEKLQLQSVLQFAGKLIGLLFIFVLVKNENDGIWVLLSNALSAIIAGLFSIFFIFKSGYFKICFPSLSGMRQEFVEGFSLFASRVSISFYTMLIPLALGWIAGPVALAYFNVADKLRVGAQSLITPISQAIFPRISHLVSKNESSAYQLIKRSAVAIFLVSGSASLMLFVLSEPLVQLMAGDGFDGAVSVLHWMSPVPFLVGMSNLFGVQLMIPLRLNIAFNRILFCAAVLCVIILWPLINYAEASGAAITLMIVEFFVSVVMFFYLRKKQILGK